MHGQSYADDHVMIGVYCDATDAYDSARFLCENYYNTSPQCDIICHNG